MTFCSALVIAGWCSCYQLYIHVVTPRKTSFVYLSSTSAPTCLIISIVRLQYLQSITLSTSTSSLGPSFAPGPGARSTSTLVHLSQLSELSTNTQYHCRNCNTQYNCTTDCPMANSFPHDAIWHPNIATGHYMELWITGHHHSFPSWRIWQTRHKIGLENYTWDVSQTQLICSPQRSNCVT